MEANYLTLIKNKFFSVRFRHNHIDMGGGLR